MKIAIIGTGISGLTAAYRLQQQGHAIDVYEANDYVGGHTHTLDIPLSGHDYAVDTGFIVFNDRTYPHFAALLAELEVATRPTTMSFSVRCDRTGLEYNGNNLNTLFAQRRNLLRPAFYRMLLDILHFNRDAAQALESLEMATLGDYLRQQGYHQRFIDHYIVPLGAAIWSAEPQRLLQMPARFFIRFFRHHGLLDLVDRPQWRVIQGGSREYVRRLSASFRERIRLNCPVRWIRRRPTHVELAPATGAVTHYDHVVVATHSDQALALLADPSAAEHTLLSAIPYQENSVVLHTDTRLLPRRRRAWAAWNYHIPAQQQQRVAVTYNMNLLQDLDAPETFCVTLNTAAIDPARVQARLTYHHPLFTTAAVAAQSRRHEINGVNRTWYCGAYWRNGFHEDGVVSALAVTAALAQQSRLAA